MNQATNTAILGNLPPILEIKRISKYIVFKIV